MRLRDILYMPKSDRQVMLALLAVVAVAIGVIVLAGSEEQTPEPDASALLSAADSSRHSPPDAYQQGQPTTSDSAARGYYYAEGEKPDCHLFVFDPNTADSTQLLRLGLQPWQVRNIYRYRARGGVYRTKEDFANLYGLTVKKYRELEPYIRISPEYLPASTLFANKKGRGGGGAFGAGTGAGTGGDVVSDDGARDAYPQKLHAGETIDLNAADTALLKRVPGIGSYFARRIAEYRDRLGGYVSTEQLMEIPNFPESALSFFALSTASPQPRRINVNRSAAEELRRHPYVNYFQARAIVDYRRLHGPITDLSQLGLNRDFTEEAIERLRPYVEY